ncbi:MAG: RNA polymerase sigma factor [Bacteroidetes bacterium]|nr:MAG: RNA polymerase sigma factor [Bacteroidota bacterium]
MTTLEFNTAVVMQERSLRPAALKLTRNMEAANDLIQDTFVKAISNREKFSEGTNLKAWLYTIMRNTFITNYHRVVRRNTFIDTTENLHYLNADSYSTSNEAFSRLRTEEIEEAIEELSDTYKTPFMMYFRGYKYHEIADILGIPIGTVKNRIHIARKELKSRLRHQQ